MSINCKTYQTAKLLSQCELGELVLFDFRGSNVLSIPGEIEGKKLPLLIICEIGDQSIWSNLPIAIAIDPIGECISYGANWFLEAVPSLSDKVINSGYREKAGTLLLGNKSTHMTVHESSSFGSAELRHYNLDNMKRQDTFEELRSTCKVWKIWLSQEDMECGVREPLFEFDCR